LMGLIGNTRGAKSRTRRGPRRASRSRSGPRSPARKEPKGAKAMVGVHRGAAEHAAETIANVVGDGCVVRLYDSVTGGLEAAAVAHRDRERRQMLSELLGGPPLSPELGWGLDAFPRNLGFRPR